MSKVEINIPPQFSEAIEKAAEKEGITADELTKRAIKKNLERSIEDVKKKKKRHNSKNRR